MKNNLRKRDDRCMYGNNLVRFMRNDLNTQLEYCDCDGYTLYCTFAANLHYTLHVQLLIYVSDLYEAGYLIYSSFGSLSMSYLNMFKVNITL